VLDVDTYDYIIPNSDGRGYGLFIVEDNSLKALLNSWPSIADELTRQATIMNLWELYQANHISDQALFDSLVAGLESEQNALVASTVCGYLGEPLHALHSAEAEGVLYAMSESHALKSCRQQLMRLLMQVATSSEINAKFYTIWHEASHPLLSINDYMTLSYELALRYPERYDEIVTTQRERITDEDRRRQFDYIVRAVNPSPEAQKALFMELLEPEMRRIEPWAATTLSYLNHPLRDEESSKLIYRGLDELREVQRTGDIFFPRNWVGALLGNHRSKEAYDELQRWLEDNADYPTLLRNKILQAAHPLSRVQR
jgi:aminopeptidase N